jgi:hypothetical protein
MRITVLGKHWWFQRVKNLKHDGKKADGLCEDPSCTHKSISIDSKLSGQRELTVIVHELIHASGWNILDHDYVTQFAEDVGRILTKLGYRKVE